MNKKHTILIVNDSKNEAQYLGTILNNKGYKILIAASGKECLQLASSNPISLALIDGILPDYSGLEILKQLKRNTQTKHITVIYYTALENKNHTLEALRNGAADFIIKSNNFEELVLRIQMQISRTEETNKLQNNIKTSEERFKLMLDHTHDAEFYRNANGTIEYVSPGFERILGYNASDYMLNKIKFEDITHPNDLPMAKEYFNRAMQGHQLSNFTCRYIHANGKIVHGSINVVPVLNQQNELMGIRTSLRDITNMIELQNQIIAKEKQFRTLVENTSDWLWEIDRKGNYIYSNPRVYNITGYHPEEITGQSIFDLMEPPEIKRIKSILKEKIANKEPIVQLYNQVKHKSGKIIHVETSAEPIINDSGKLIGYIGIDRDISEREKYRINIEKSNERFRKLAEISTQGILIHDKLKAIDCNNKLCSLLNLSREQIINQDITQFFSDKALKQIKQFDKKNITAPFEIEIALSTNKIHTVETIIRTIDWGGRNVKVLTFNDITERKRFENEILKSKQAAEQANTAKEALLSNISHELRTPLNAIMGFTEMAIKNATEKSLKRTLEIVLDNSSKLKNLLINLMESTKLHNQNMQLNYNPININNLIKEAINFIPIPSEKSLEKLYSSNIDANQMIFIDPIKLKQILKNILDNAVKFSEKGFIHINASLKNVKEKYADLIITIKDTGIGIKQEFMPYMFEYFSQQEHSDARNYGGTGLGLAICKQLTELMNGKIFAESTINQGTKITLFFPQLKLNEHSDSETEKLTHSSNSIQVAIFTSSELKKHLTLTIKHPKIKIKYFAQFDSLIEYLSHSHIPEIIIGKTLTNSQEITLYKLLQQYETEFNVIGITPSKSKNKKSQLPYTLIFETYNAQIEIADYLNNLTTETEKISSKQNADVNHESFLEFDAMQKTKMRRELENFRPELDKKWEELNNRISIKNLDVFLTQLKNAHTLIPHPYLSDYEQQLREYRETFDVANIKTLLYQFPEVMRKIDATITSN